MRHIAIETKEHTLTRRAHHRAERTVILPHLAFNGSKSLRCATAEGFFPGSARREEWDATELQAEDAELHNSIFGMVGLKVARCNLFFGSLSLGQQY